jgi:nitrile hydratase subunit beta
VRTRSQRVVHHTRLPGYAHGKQGVIESVQGAHVFADTHAQGLGEQPQWLYRVAFSGTELWGADAAPGTSVALDAWESYLESAA